MDMQFYPQASFSSMPGFPAGQPGFIQYPEGQYTGQPGYGIQYMYQFAQPRSAYMGEHAALVDGKTESKPRLTKEEVDRLEKEFRKNPKPSSSVKAQLADSLRLERARINNWFQNRRAKAKQEKKQEEYEARRAAEHEPSESASPQEYSLSNPSERFNENNGRQRMQPSSALFPDVSASPHMSTPAVDPAHEEDSDSKPEVSRSPDLHQSRDESSDAFQPQLPVDFSSGMVEFSDAQPMDVYNHDVKQERLASPFALNQSLDPAGTASSQCSGLSPNAHSAELQFQSMVEAGYPSTTTAPFQGQTSSGVEGMENWAHVHENMAKGFPNGHGEYPQSIPSPGDSFKSPPPPANIASRRNISHRPAALSSIALKSRSHGPKSMIDGNIRRIVSSSGGPPGRIQKPSSGPRSPMSFNKEAWMHYPMTSLPIAAPPTPMTPALGKHQSLQNLRQPTGSSNSSDDDALALGSMSPPYLTAMNTERNLETPPQSPGMMANLCAPNMMANAYGGFSNQQVFTPFSQAMFPDFPAVPEYVDGSDGSLPNTPIYSSHVVSSAHSQNPLVTNGQVGTEYDWDANKPVMLSKPSPSHARARLQFAKNVTPRNYPQCQER